MWLGTFALGGCGDGRWDAGTAADGARAGGELVLIGVSGTRLGDGDRYQVPLDDGRPIPIEVTRREAFVLMNEGEGATRIERLRLVGDSSEWRLVGPARAQEVPLAAEGQVLGPGAGLDFDVAVSPRWTGTRRAVLWLEWSAGDRWEGAAVTLYAEAFGPPSTGPPGADAAASVPLGATLRAGSPLEVTTLTATDRGAARRRCWRRRLSMGPCHRRKGRGCRGRRPRRRRRRARARRGS